MYNKRIKRIIMKQVKDRTTRTDLDISNRVSQTSGYTTTFWVANDFERATDRYNQSVFV